MNLDGNGLIVSRTWAGNLDGGDTLAETGRIYFLKRLCNIQDSLQPFEKAVDLLKNSSSEWIRSPSQWTDPKDVSRDQLDPMIMAINLYGLPSCFHCYRLLYGLRYPNGDIASPEHLSHFGRTKWNKYFADLFMFLNTLIICFFSGETVANDLNHIISLCFAEYFGGTFISRQAAAIYLSHRDHNWALNSYYQPPSGNADLVQYYLAGLKWLGDR